MQRLCQEKKIRLLVFGNPSVKEGLIEEKPEEKDDGKGGQTGVVSRYTDIANEENRESQLEEGDIEDNPEPAPVSVFAYSLCPAERPLFFQEGSHFVVPYCN